MPYYDVTPHTLYQSLMSIWWDAGVDPDNPVTRARCWVEAVNIYDVWLLVQEWFLLMKSGEAVLRYPDPHWKDEDYPGKASLTQEVADECISEMDADFM